jgi:hypothetical protein
MKNTKTPEKGKSYYCHTTLIMNSTIKNEKFTKGKTYISENSSCLTNNSGNKNHYFSDGYEKWFSLIEKEQPKAYNYEVVHCKTQEEWDFVCLKIKNPPLKESFENCDTNNSKGNCIDYNRHSNFCWKDYYVKRGDTLIYSFEEWCSKFNHKMPNNTPKLPIVDEVYDSIPEECINNDVIEVGDFVNWEDSGTFNKENYEGYEIWKIKEEKFWIIYQNAKEDYQNYPLNIEGLKITKKANTQTTTINKKPDISSAIQIGNDNTTNIVIPKSASVVLKNTENEVKIKINQTKTIKIN